MRLYLIFLLAFLCSCSTSNLLLKESLSPEFSFSDVIKLAETEAKKTYQAKQITLPDIIKNMSYDQYNEIKYNHEYDLWYKKGIHYRVSFFHLGMLYNTPVDIYEITDEKIVKPVPFSPDFFSCFSKDAITINKAMPKNVGYAGFRLTYDLERKDDLPNDAVFLGSSYFRIASGGCSYGLSNRGIAINTGLENVPEEFPVFEKFWIKKPEKKSKEIAIYAYLNSPSVTGAYYFTIKLGASPEIDVKSVLFLRQKVQLLGLAPITSMFWFTTGILSSFPDTRPSVHNSEGVIVSDSGREIWEPLVNYPLHKMINDDIYCSSIPNYFGLIQRKREYNFYMDPGVKYHLNPNCWIIPKNNWGAGKIRLFILPTLREWEDNINIFWIPDNMPEIGKPFEFDYKIIYSLKEPERKLAYVKYTNIGVDLNNAKNKVFILSYDDKTGEIEKNIKNIKVKVELPKEVRLINQKLVVEKIPYNNTWRTIIALRGKKLNYADKPYIIKVTLMVKKRPISETWYYQWYP